MYRQDFSGFPPPPPKYFLKAISPDGNLLWQKGLEGSVATLPVIADDGTIYIGASSLEAHSRSGDLLWKYTPESSGVLRLALGPDGTIYFTCGYIYPRVYAISQDGELKWFREFISPYASVSPLAVDAAGTIYVYADADSTLYALNADGAIKWSFSVPGASYGPVIGEYSIIYLVDKSVLRAIGE